MKKALSIILASCMTLGAMAQVRYQNRPPEKRQSVSQLERDVQKMVMATAMIYNYYVDSVDSKRLAEDAINGILIPWARSFLIASTTSACVVCAKLLKRMHVRQRTGAAAHRTARRQHDTPHRVKRPLPELRNS